MHLAVNSTPFWSFVWRCDENVFIHNPISEEGIKITRKVSSHKWNFNAIMQVNFWCSYLVKFLAGPKTSNGREKMFCCVTSFSFFLRASCRQTKAPRIQPPSSVAENNETQRWKTRRKSQSSPCCCQGIYFFEFPPEKHWSAAAWRSPNGGVWLAAGWHLKPL